MSMKEHNAFMASIPSKRDDLAAQAAAEVDSPGFLLTTVEKLAGLAQARSLWPVTMGLACCAIEMMAAGTPRFDMARFFQLYLLCVCFLSPQSTYVDKKHL